MELTWDRVDDDTANHDEDKRNEKLNDRHNFVSHRMNQAFDDHRVKLLPPPREAVIALKTPHQMLQKYTRYMYIRVN